MNTVILIPTKPNQAKTNNTLGLENRYLCFYNEQTSRNPDTQGLPICQQNDQNVLYEILKELIKYLKTHKHIHKLNKQAQNKNR